MWARLNDDAHAAAIAEIERQGDRGAAVVAVAFLEDRLTFALTESFQNRNRRIENAMLAGSGPLATFATKIDLGFLIGLYPESSRRILHQIRKIRNDFAHTMLPLEFSTPQIRDRCSHFASPTSYADRLDRFLPGTKGHNIAKIFFESLSGLEDTPRNRFMSMIKIHLLALTLGGVAAQVAKMEPARQDSNLIKGQLSSIQLLDVVALTTDVPENGLVRGQVGTVVEVVRPDTYEIEFSDDDGRTYAQLPLREDQLLVLHYRPRRAA